MGRVVLWLLFRECGIWCEPLKQDKMKTTPECKVNRAVKPALKVKRDTLYIMYNLGGTTEIISSLDFSRDVFILEERL